MTTQTTSRTGRILDALGGEDHHARLALATAERHHITALLPGDEHWPTALEDLGADAPAMLWAHGDTSLLARSLTQRIAITGARACTAYGEHVATDLAAALSGAGHVLVTGGAYGIDATVHRAVRPGGAPGIAVLASGIDRLYPTGNTDLLQDVAATGLLLSEAPPGAVPTRQRFVQRGRIIAALCGATVIVEAAYRSGALTVAHRALALRRIVAAVPGPVTSAASAGCHQLIQNGETHLITHAGDLTALIT
ncbi:MAG TPA: DNA-processing protein DprA [Lacisediminihabitans sp.]|jgi:DNA processing protein|uniref:DNA-processing protein DprA n=1 Tax=Lacisediminihabitans sp. TaxID=2787631 RepID=UPI002ED87E4C